MVVVFDLAIDIGIGALSPTYNGCILSSEL